MTNTDATVNNPRIKRPLRFFLIRHGESEANIRLEGVYGTVPDESIQLTEKGFAQADACGQFMHDFLTANPLEGGVSLYNSSYMRARQTAQRIYDQIIPAVPALRVHESDLLIEQHHGFLDSLSDEDKARLYPEYKTREDRHWKDGSKLFAPIHGGEMRAQVAHRVDTFKDALFREINDHGSNTIIIVSHGITMRMIAKVLLKMTREASDLEKNPHNCDVRLLQRFGENNSKFGDFGAIWHQGKAVAPQLVEYPRPADLLAGGAYRQHRPYKPAELVA